MLPPGLFIERSFCLWVGTSFFQTLAYYGSLFAIPIALQARGWSAVQVGATMLPMTLVTGILASLSGWLSARLGSANICMVGLFAAAIGGGILAAMEPSWGAMLGAGLLLGLGGATLPLIVSSCLCTVPSMRVGVGAGVLNTARQTGGVIGIALLGLCLQGQEGAARAMAVVTLAFLLAGGLVLLQRRLGMAAALSDAT
ncbi:drug resistance MFS transporter, drug:H+ antiporter-2 (14 Spanner) (DHA2) family [compost metagenome]